MTSVLTSLHFPLLHELHRNQKRCVNDFSTNFLERKYHAKRHQCGLQTFGNGPVTPCLIVGQVHTCICLLLDNLVLMAWKRYPHIE